MMRQAQERMMTRLTPVDLRRVLVRLFDEEELVTLCFDLDVDYESLPAQGKAAKARELVKLCERIGQSAVLEAAIRQERPSLDTIYSPERVQQLQLTVLEEITETGRDAFVELTRQVDAYLNQFNLLHEQMEEWKEVHNLLQDMQNYFAPCRSYIYSFGRLLTSPNRQQEEERLLYEVEVEWRPCKRVLRRLEEFATGILAIGEAYDSAANQGPNWLLKPQTAAQKLDKALFRSDIIVLRESLSDFGDQVDQYLYLADKALLKVANEIMHLPRPRPRMVVS
jgi:hypothetical protein